MSTNKAKIALTIDIDQVLMPDIEDKLGFTEKKKLEPIGWEYSVDGIGFGKWTYTSESSTTQCEIKYSVDMDIPYQSKERFKDEFIKQLAGYTNYISMCIFGKPNMIFISKSLIDYVCNIVRINLQRTWRFSEDDLFEISKNKLTDRGVRMYCGCELIAQDSVCYVDSCEWHKKTIEIVANKITFVGIKTCYAPKIHQESGAFEESVQATIDLRMSIGFCAIHPHMVYAPLVKATTLWLARNVYIDHILISENRDFCIDLKSDNKFLQADINAVFQVKRIKELLENLFVLLQNPTLDTKTKNDLKNLEKHILKLI